MAICLSDKEFYAAYERLFTPLLATTRHELGCTAQDALDIVCDARLVAYTLLDRFDLNRYDPESRPADWQPLDWQARFNLWIAQIHRNQCLSWRSAQRRAVTTVPLADVEELADDTPPTWRERYQHLIDALPEREQDAVNLHLDGYTQLEIADTLGCHRNTVPHLLETAQDRLRAWDNAESWASAPLSGGEGNARPNDALTIPDIIAPLTPQDFKSISKVVKYHKPPGKMGLWKRSLPPNRTFRFSPPTGARMARNGGGK